MKKINILKKVWNVLSTVIVVFMVLCAVFLMGSRLMGYQVFNVVSGSMEPTYSVGDLIYVKKVNPNEIEVGMPITFVLNEDLVVATHRVIEVDAENQHFYTKGEANDTADASPVHFNNVIGVPQFSIPLLGYVSDFIQNPPGTYITIGVGVLMVLAVFLSDLFGKKKQETQMTDHSKMDKCVLCGIDTEVEVSTPIDIRKHYISGAGQLCEVCYAKVHMES